MTPIRLTVAATHPVQYLSPWFRHLAARHPELALTVLYATRPTPAQQGVGFGEAFEWDLPLEEGYRSRVVRPARSGDDVGHARLFGLDVPEMTAALDETRPDVVLLAGWHSVTQLRALWHCRRRGVPVIYRGDSNLASGPRGLLRPAWAARTRFLLAQFSAYLAVGRRARAYLAHFGAPAHRIFQSPHAVDNASFAQAAAAHRTAQGRAAARRTLGVPEDAFVVAFVGKLEEKKRPADLVDAVAQLGSGVHLLFVGAGPEAEALRAQVARLGVRATFAGFLNQSALPRAYAAADCLALPSDARETWGLVANEALACGVPIVVSEAAGCAPDLVVTDPALGQTGEMHPLGDTAALAAALGRLRARIAAGHDFSPACTARAAVFSFDVASAGLVAACQVSARRPTRRVVALCGGMIAFTGLERATVEVLRVARDEGAHVHMVVNGWDNRNMVTAAATLGASHSIGAYATVLSRHTRDPRKLATYAWDIARTSAGLAADAARLRATHIVVADIVTVVRNAPALFLLRRSGVKVLLRLGNAPDGGPFYRRLWHAVILPCVDHVYCNSKFTEAATHALGVPAERTSLIYNAPPCRAGPAPSSGAYLPGRLVYVGQIIPDKGLDALIDAVALLVRRGRDVTLDVVGEHEGWIWPPWAGWREALLQRATRGALAGRVRFLGFREDVPALLARAAVHVCPSRIAIREGFGLVVAEAKAAGVPSVVTPSGALPELVRDREEGVVLASDDAEAIAAGVAWMLEDEDRLDRLREAARRSAARFDHAKMAQLWRAAFR